MAPESRERCQGSLSPPMSAVLGSGDGQGLLGQVNPGDSFRREAALPVTGLKPDYEDNEGPGLSEPQTQPQATKTRANAEN
jgi:hypothetical protein